MAVLLVSSTCTSAGCVLCALSGSPAAAASQSCCGQSLPTGHDGKRDCPLCRHSVQIGSTAQKSVAPIDVHFLDTLIPATAESTAVGAQPLGLRSLATLGAPPSRTSSTLLALHCALLA